MDILIITIITLQILTFCMMILGFLRIANLIGSVAEHILETIGPIREITENIAGIPADFDPFQNGIKQMLLEKMQDLMAKQKEAPEIKEYTRSNDGTFA
jgi:hypothetical protein